MSKRSSALPTSDAAGRGGDVRAGGASQRLVHGRPAKHGDPTTTHGHRPRPADPPGTFSHQNCPHGQTSRPGPTPVLYGLLGRPDGGVGPSRKGSGVTTFGVAGMGPESVPAAGVDQHTGAPSIQEVCLVASRETVPPTRTDGHRALPGHRHGPVSRCGVGDSGPHAVPRLAGRATHSHVGAPVDRRFGGRPVVLYSPGGGTVRIFGTLHVPWTAC